LKFDIIPAMVTEGGKKPTYVDITGSLPPSIDPAPVNAALHVRQLRAVGPLDAEAEAIVTANSLMNSVLTRMAGATQEVIVEGERRGVEEANAEHFITNWRKITDRFYWGMVRMALARMSDAPVGNSQRIEQLRKKRLGFGKNEWIERQQRGFRMENPTNDPTPGIDRFDLSFSTTQKRVEENLIGDPELEGVHELRYIRREHHGRLQELTLGANNAGLSEVKFFGHQDLELPEDAKKFMQFIEKLSLSEGFASVQEVGFRLRANGDTLPTLTIGFPSVMSTPPELAKDPSQVGKRMVLPMFHPSHRLVFTYDPGTHSFKRKVDLKFPPKYNAENFLKVDADTVLNGVEAILATVPQSQ
jgi:hypothetical protein